MTYKSTGSFWRMAGMTYLQYLNVATRATRAVLKEPAKSRAIAREFVFYNKTVTGSPKVPITTFVAK